MAIRPLDISLAIQASPQIAAISKSTEEAPRVAQAEANLEHEKALEVREEMVTESERTARAQAADRERREQEERRSNRQRGRAYDGPAGRGERDDLEETGEHLIDISV